MRFIKITLVLIIVFGSIGIFAHPAENVTLKYDKETCMLSIRIVHNSKDYNKHFIEKVWVSVNKKNIVKQDFSSQDDLEGLQLQYKIFNLKKGDRISVDTKCNIFGKQFASIEIE